MTGETGGGGALNKYMDKLLRLKTMAEGRKEQTPLCAGPTNMTLFTGSCVTRGIKRTSSHVGALTWVHGHPLLRFDIFGTP